LDGLKLKSKYLLVVASLLLGSITCNSQDYYQIDESFSTDGHLNKGYISNTYLEESETIFISGTMQNLNSNWGSINRISTDGQLIDVLEPGFGSGALVYQYLDGFIVGGFGGGYNRFDYAGNSYSDYDFLYNNQPYNQGWNLANKVIQWPDGDFIAAGRWTVDTLVPLEDGLAGLIKMNPDGSPDENFNPIFLEQEEGLAFNFKYLRSIDTLSSGELIVAGKFNKISGETYHHIAKLNQDFSVDTSFQNPLSEEGEAKVLLVDSEDRIWLILSSSFIPEAPEYEFIVRLLPDGSVDYSYEHPELIVDIDNFPLTESWPRQIHELPDGTFLITGSIVEANGLPCKTMVHITEDGEVIDDFWRQTGPDEAVWPGWDKRPWTGNLLFLENGDILIDGHFSSWDGHPTSNIAKLNPMTIGLDESIAIKMFRLYPNPANDQITIQPKENWVVANTTVQIRDALGRLVLSVPLSNQRVDVSRLKPGFYLVQVIDAGKPLGTAKLIVE
jgi:hypothetical protein